MQLNDICIVHSDRNSVHPDGTKVKVILVVPDKYDDPKPYYCQTLEGNSCYWYKPTELEVIEREGMI